MSTATDPALWLREVLRSNLPDESKQLARTLRKLAIDDGFFSNSLGYLAKASGMPLLEAKRELHALVLRGWLTIALPSDGKKPHLYALNLPDFVSVTHNVTAA